MDARGVEDFWQAVRPEIEVRYPGLVPPEAAPEAWGFGATPQHADELLALVLSGVKTGTASALWDYEAADESLPEVGSLSIILDGADVPRAVIETTAIQITPFDEVGAEHAHSEGEGDLTLDYWRASHERYWRNHSENPRGFEPDMPIVCERFRLLIPASSEA